MEIETLKRSQNHTKIDGGVSSPPEFEFEFWMVGNHPELEPNLLTADELIVDGVLLPLHLLSISQPKSTIVTTTTTPHPDPVQEPETRSEPPPESSICSTAPSTTGSKRWTDIFKVGEKKKESGEKKQGNRGSGPSELNINIWPFSRSRSAGTAASGRPKAAGMRKSSSAPCSRSNSRGERRWAASPARPGGGVHVGRASPVWQARRNRDKAARRGPISGLNLNVNSCIGYGKQASCRAEDGDGDGITNNGGLFRFKSLFTKKVY